MVDFRDYYAILGVPRDASQADIKKAYRRLAREHHPDVKPGDKAAEQRFKDLNEAHTVLSDPEKRRKYDRFGKDWQAYAAAGGGGDPFAPGSPFADMFRAAGGDAGGRGRAGQARAGQAGDVRYEFRTSGDAGFSDFFRMVFGEGGPEGPAGPGATRTRSRTRQTAGGATSGEIDDVLADMGFGPFAGGTSPGASRGRPTRPRAPRAIEATAELSLEEAFHGAVRRVEVDGKRLEVTIPRGVDSGSRIKLTGQGGDGRDLVVVCLVRPHPVFSRRGADLERELPIRLEEALLGAEVPVTTLKGRVLLKIPPETQTGRSFRLTGQGMPRFRAEGAGDLYVKVRVVLPTGLSDEAKDLARRFLDLARQPDPRTS